MVGCNKTNGQVAVIGIIDLEDGTLFAKTYATVFETQLFEIYLCLHQSKRRLKYCKMCKYALIYKLFVTIVS